MHGEAAAIIGRGFELERVRLSAFGLATWQRLALALTRFRGWVIPDEFRMVRILGSAFITGQAYDGDV